MFLLSYQLIRTFSNQHVSMLACRTISYAKTKKMNNVYILIPDVATEKTQNALFDGIEKFDATRLKHTETQEKNPLPDKDGKLHTSLNIYGAWLSYSADKPVSHAESSATFKTPLSLPTRDKVLLVIVYLFHFNESINLSHLRGSLRS